MAELQVTDSKGKKNYDITGDPEIVLIGRDRTCFIQIQDENASRRHARILKVGQTFNVEDMQSRNGTFVNEVQITAKRPLRDGDVVRIGAVKMVWKENMSAVGAVSYLMASPLFWWALMIFLAGGILGSIGYLVHRLLLEVSNIQTPH
ncbi:MAG: FHA domain-containing protein [Planctomycetes bacterium]|nr:FHA domain-containing protein [Planctomycetota bacterium]